MKSKLDSIEIGKIIRAKRKKLNLTQEMLAALCNVGTRFISELERGKPTVQLNKTLIVMHKMGIKIEVII
jgi:y4mF family transcriptional regulator